MSTIQKFLLVCGLRATESTGFSTIRTKLSGLIRTDGSINIFADKVASKLEPSKSLIRHVPNSNFDPEKDYVLIYQYGKVGSSSVSDTFSSLMGVSVDYESHTKPSYARGAKVHDLAVARDFIAKCPNGSRIWVITMSRSLLSLRISSYFQWLSIDRGVARGFEGWFPKQEVLNADMNTLHNGFRAFLAARGFRTDFFTKEFANVTGKDITLQPVDLDTRTIFVEPYDFDHTKMSILYLQLEHIANWDIALQRYVHKSLTTKKSNIASRRWYADVYTNFLNSFKYAQSDVDAAAKGDTFLLYTDEEKQAMLGQHISSIARNGDGRAFYVSEDQGRNKEGLHQGPSKDAPVAYDVELDTNEQ